MFCTNCGEENEDNAKLCKNCGNPINQNQNEVPKTKNNNHKIKSESNKIITTNSTNSNLKIIVIAVIAFIIFCGLVFTVTSTFLNQKGTIDGITFNVPDDFEIIESKEHETDHSLGYLSKTSRKTFKKIKSEDNSKLNILVSSFDDSDTAEKFTYSFKNKFIEDGLPVSQLKLKNINGYGQIRTSPYMFLYCYGDQVIFITYDGEESDLIKDILP